MGPVWLTGRPLLVELELDTGPEVVRPIGNFPAKELKSGLEGAVNFPAKLILFEGLAPPMFKTVFSMLTNVYLKHFK